MAFHSQEVFRKKARCGMPLVTGTPQSGKTTALTCVAAMTGSEILGTGKSKISISLKLGNFTG